MMRRIVARRSGVATLPSAVKPTSCWRFIGCPRGQRPSNGSSPVLPPLSSGPLPERARHTCLHVESRREGRAPRLRSWCPIPLVPERRGLATSKHRDREIAEAVRYVQLAEKRAPDGAEHGRDRLAERQVRRLVFEE